MKNRLVTIQIPINRLLRVSIRFFLLFSIPFFPVVLLKEFYIYVQTQVNESFQLNKISNSNKKNRPKNRPDSVLIHSRAVIS